MLIAYNLWHQRSLDTMVCILNYFIQIATLLVLLLQQTFMAHRRLRDNNTNENIRDALGNKKK